MVKEDSEASHTLKSWPACCASLSTALHMHVVASKARSERGREKAVSTLWWLGKTVCPSRQTIAARATQSLTQ